ncbi:MAG: hypothetical protein ACR2IM_03065, partial [Sediminibacterium sp.]
MKNQLTLLLKNSLLLALVILFSLNAAFSQVLPFETVKSNKFDYTKLAQIDSVVNKYINNRWLIGSSVI